ncbi:uncharacterized protein LOC124811384 [Hydra vulgaris]|uniref:uncharacterized protein LOC124811384 n=1 Tax=Hydra vulgaris TaxID=6087 RepID=UPI0032EA405A
MKCYIGTKDNANNDRATKTKSNIKEKELLSLELIKELYENSVKLIEESLKAAILDETFSIIIEGLKTPGNYAAELALCIVENAGQKKIDFCKNIFEVFLPIVNLCGNTSQLGEQQCTMLNCLIKNVVLRSSWNEFVFDFSNFKAGFDILYLFILKTWFKNAIDWRNHV